MPAADRQEQSAIKAQQAHEAFEPATKQQEGRFRPVAPSMPHYTVTQEEWNTRQYDAATQKINDAQTRLNAANARYADAARYGTTGDRIALRTEIGGLEQQIKGLKKERGDPGLIERFGKTLSGTVKQYFRGMTNAFGVAAEGQKGTAMTPFYQSEVDLVKSEIEALEKTLNDSTMTAKDIAETNELLQRYRTRLGTYETAVRAGENTAQEVYKISDALSESGARDIERAKEGASTFGKIGIDVLSQGMQMGTDAALGAITGGGALAPMAIRSFGSGAQEARQDGADLGQAVNYGAASAAVEVITEKIVDFAGVYGGKGTADDMIKRAINKLTTDETLRGALEIAASAAGESVEEFVSGIVNPALKSLYNGKSIGENRSELEWKDVLYDMLIGGILGGVGGAVDVVRDGNVSTQTVDNAVSEASTESTAINTDPTGHTSAEQAVINAYQNAVDTGLIAFVDRVRTLKNPNYRNRIRYPISEVTSRQAEAVRRITGVDATDFDNIITGGTVDHIENRHGKNGKADQSMADVNDLARIQYVLENFDEATPLMNKDGTPSVSDVWKNSDGTPAQRILFTKKVDGTYYAAIAAPDSNAHVLAVESAFMSKNSGSTGTVLNMEGGSSPQVTPETPQRANASTMDSTIAQPPNAVKPGESAPASYADTLREMQQPGTRQPTSYADDLAHANELLQNAALSPRDQAYIQKDIADAQRSCDAAMKAIVNPSITSEERAQAVRRSIDALDYARQRIGDLGLPATQLRVSMAQDALADIAERLKSYLLE